MFVLAHISDLHMAARPRLAELASKRGLGFINWQRKRKFIHRPETLDAITGDLKRYGSDHIAVTGDLVNLSLDAEYRRARAWLDALGPPERVTVIPGNHDAYVPQARRAAAASWGPYMRDDAGAGPGLFPFIRRRGNIALIALSSAVPTGPFLASGRVGAEQLDALAAALERLRECFRIVLIHHPPVTPLRHYLRRLTDAEPLRRVLAAHGAELLLHGHDHRRAVIWLDGPRGTRIPVVGVPSASAHGVHGDENAAGYNVFRIEAETAPWRCELLARDRAPDGAIGDGERHALR